MIEIAALKISYTYSHSNSDTMQSKNRYDIDSISLHKLHSKGAYQPHSISFCATLLLCCKERLFITLGLGVVFAKDEQLPPKMIARWRYQLELRQRSIDRMRCEVRWCQRRRLNGEVASMTGGGGGRENLTKGEKMDRVNGWNAG
jgi:hypothetical protein